MEGALRDVVQMKTPSRAGSHTLDLQRSQILCTTVINAGLAREER